MPTSSIQLTQNTEWQFNQLRGALRAMCSPSQFICALEQKTPTAAQLLRLLEINLLTESEMSIKGNLTQLLADHARGRIHSLVAVRGNAESTFEEVKGYKDVVRMGRFLESEIGRLVGPAEEQNRPETVERQSYSKAWLQDLVRRELRTRLIPVEDRRDYVDPIGTRPRRTRDDFLAGRGVVDVALRRSS